MSNTRKPPNHAPATDDANVIESRPLRDRPLLPNVAELAGEHRGERPRDAR